MGGLLDALRRGGNDAIRQSTSLTTAYLLEQNRKFEAYMREKVAALEGRVAGQQARLAAREGEDFNDLEWLGLGDTSSAVYGEIGASGDTAPVPRVTVEPEVMGFDGLKEPGDEDEALHRRDAVDTLLESTVPSETTTSPASEEPPDWMVAFGVASARPGDDPEIGDEEAEPAAGVVPAGEELESEGEEGDGPGLFDGPRWLAGEEEGPPVPVTGGVLGLTAIFQGQPPEEEDLPVEPLAKRNGGAVPTAAPGMDLGSTGQSPAPAAGHQGAAGAVVSPSPPRDVNVAVHQGVEGSDDDMGDWDASLPDGPTGDYA